MPAYALPNGVLKVALPAGRQIVRVHHIDKGALWFGPAPGAPPAYRFDAPGGEFRTLYCAEQLTGAFVETVLRQAKRIIGRPFVDARGWTVLNCKRELRLAKIYDEGLIHHGVTADICAGDNYTDPRQFAAAIYAADPEVDGIAYRARHNNGQICYAVFDRVGQDQFVEVDRHAFRSERAIIEAIMREHGASWDPMPPLLPA
ncbi:RES family NAD+ phosphorylase [Bradyrhizobium sp. USDA 4506]